MGSGTGNNIVCENMTEMGKDLTVAGYRGVHVLNRTTRHFGYRFGSVLLVQFDWKYGMGFRTSNSIV